MKTKTLSQFIFGNHNTPNAIEDYCSFSAVKLKCFLGTILITKQIISGSKTLIVQEDFNSREAKNIILWKTSAQDKKLVIIATENICGDSFNDKLEINKILAKEPDLIELGINQIKSDNLPSFLFKKYLQRFGRDIQGFRSVMNRIKHDHLGILQKRYINFLKLGPLADQIWLMPGLDPIPYFKLFGDRVKPFPFVLTASDRRDPKMIKFRAMLSGKISPHRKGLLSFLSLEQPTGFLIQETWEKLVITSSFDIPLSIRLEMLKTVGIYLDLPVSEESSIFSSMKAAVALEAGVPFFACTQADPGRFAPFVRTFSDIRSLKESVERYSKEELVEMGAQFSSAASKVFVPSAYPFLEELLK